MGNQRSSTALKSRPYDHAAMMLRCLELAARGRGRVGNGAMVGAVLVRTGEIIAEGYHAGFGEPHAERVLLENFEGSIEGDDVLYVNLEPCCHQGKTPPCTDIIFERGIQHVVFGMLDPDPRVSGQGMALLRARGVSVTGPVDRAWCEWFNRGFVNVRTKGRPWITLKMAQDRAGMIANADGSPRRMTSHEQDIWSHTRLRASHDAILVGVGTIVSDDPVLTPRLAMGRGAPVPWRIVLDPHGRIPDGAKVLRDENAARTIVVSGPLPYPPLREGKKGRAPSLKGGVHVLYEDGMFVWEELWKVLTEPKGDYPGITNVLVEGGAKTWEMFRRAGMVDEEVVLVGQ